MTIRELVLQGFYYARTCRSLWLFGLIVGLTSGGSSNGGSSGGGGGGAGGAGAGLAAVLGGLFEPSPAAIAAIVAVALVLVAAGVLLRYVSEGALIEGVVQARRGSGLTTGDGFRAGWAHWGVLVRIALLYVGAFVVSLALLAAPCVVGMLAFGPIAAVLLAVPAIVVAVPWLVVLHLVQAFAGRIAVLEERRAIDAIRKARLFLHGRLVHGLKLMVATFVGTLLITAAMFIVLAPVVVAFIVLMPFLGVPAALGLAGLVALPLLGLFTAVLGTFRSSVWTIGYLAQAES